MQTIWFISLISAICLEGLGRRYLPGLPAPAFYFLKDVLLLFGFLQFRPKKTVRSAALYLYRGFGAFWVASLVWTVIEVFNPEHQSLGLGLLGLRAYWLWWLAPLVVASVLQNRKEKERAIYALSVLAIGVAALAAVQFASPADSNVNLYSVQNGEEIHAADMATVASTGRARVSSTFTFLSGFVAFTLTVPALLLSLGLDSQRPVLRRVALMATLATAAAIPMSGSRGAVVLGAGILLLTMWSAGLFFTRTGRRVLVGSGIAVILSIVAFPDALLGVQDRFGDREETLGRFEEVEQILPPIALFAYDYPLLGIGTGMQQNGKVSFNVNTEKWDAEGELGRYLVELGPIGFLLFWTAKLGLMVGLMRSYFILKRAGRRGSASAAFSYAGLTMVGNLTFDHNWQALYFVGCGFVLAEVASVYRERAPAAAVVSPAIAPEVKPVAGYSAVALGALEPKE
jgi:hypothetical protein